MHASGRATSSGLAKSSYFVRKKEETRERIWNMFGIEAMTKGRGGEKRRTIGASPRIKLTFLRYYSKTDFFSGRGRNRRARNLLDGKG